MHVQIIPPHDAGIAAAIEAQTGLWELPPDAGSRPLVTDPLRMVTQRYYYALQQELSFRPRQDNPKAPPVVYTPLHGVGLPWLQKVFLLPFEKVSFGIPLEGNAVYHQANAEVWPCTAIAWLLTQSASSGALALCGIITIHTFADALGSCQCLKVGLVLLRSWVSEEDMMPDVTCTPI